MENSVYLFQRQCLAFEALAEGALFSGNLVGAPSAARESLLKLSPAL
jgi:hypothetical protein